MWGGIALKIAQWLAGKGFATIIEGYKAKLASGDTRDQHATELAARELAVQQTEIEAQAQLRIAEIGHWYEPTHLFGYIMVIYFGKIIVWDKVLASWTNGNTDPITGDAGQWAAWIMLFYVGKRGIENVARILKR